MLGAWLALTLGTPFLAFCEPAPFALSGFGTLAIARSTDGSAQFVRNLSQPEGLGTSWRFENDSSLGIQANIGVREDLEAVAQVVTHYRYDGRATPDLTWGFLRYDPSPTWTLRAGRLGTEFYLLADSRMVGYSYVTVRPPVDFYGTLPFNYMNGADLAVTSLLPSGGLVTGKLYGGVSRERAPLGKDPDFDMSGSVLAGAYLDVHKGPWQVRLSHTRMRFKNDLPLDYLYDALPEATADALRVAGEWTHFTSLGMSYDASPFQAQLMVSKTGNTHAAFQDTWAGYLVLSYRVGELTPFVGLSAAKSSPKRLSHPLPPYTDLYLQDFHSDQRSLFFGARWDFMKNTCLKAQVDVIRGQADSEFLYVWETSEWDGSMAVLSLSLDFVF
ncbi:hypothetical protein [Thiorhodococcus minor]|uniref:Porin n=1 Tax=Thiorhodococcus minor TaxID=57489 RepID=A0A6M0JYI8_9GAMM|nr:hypothetical protein [Thiorhodococcus minor]NEV62091.1 hypothetical protein [Thiorhodococcus minor]